MQFALGLVSALLLLLTTLVHGASGQAYHFSKGWAAGKRSQRLEPQRGLLEGPAGRGTSDSGYQSRAGEDDVSLDTIGQRIGSFLAQRAPTQCMVRPEINAIIEQLIQLEAERLEGCRSNTYTNREEATNFISWIKTKLHSTSSGTHRK